MSHAGQESSANACGDVREEPKKTKLLPRETGHDIGMGSPVPLSAEAVDVITKLRNMKDEDEDWSRWRDVVFRTKAALNPKGMRAPTPPPQNKRKRGSSAFPEDKNQKQPQTTAVGSTTIAEEAAELPRPAEKGVPDNDNDETQTSRTASPEPVQLTPEDALARLKIVENPDEPEQTKGTVTLQQDTTQMHYCPECYLPIHPDPKPERLYIFLHALRYTTSLGSFETEMPMWATNDWIWDRS